MKKARYGDAANAIRALAAREKGVSLIEVAAAIGKTNQRSKRLYRRNASQW